MSDGELVLTPTLLLVASTNKVPESKLASLENDALPVTSILSPKVTEPEKLPLVPPMLEEVILPPLKVELVMSIEPRLSILFVSEITR